MIKNSTSSKHLFAALTAAFTMLLFSGMMLTGTTANAQVVYTQSFDLGPPYPADNLPNGWSQGKYCATVGAYPAGTCNDADNYWDRMGAGSPNPAASPRTGTGMMRFRSNLITGTEKSYLSSKRLDMTSMPAGGATGSFWIYRDNNVVNDNIAVFANISPGMTAGYLGPIITVPRNCGAAPVGTCNAWYQVNFTIPYAAPFIGSSSVYVTIMGVSGSNGNNIYLDDFTIDTYPITNQDIVPQYGNVVDQNLATTAPNLINQQIIGINILTNGASTPPGNVGVRDLTFNTNGSTNPITDIVNAKLWYTGGSNQFNASSALLLGTVISPWATNYTFLIGGPLFRTLEAGSNYFWITYDLAPGAIAGNYVDAQFVGFIDETISPANTAPRAPFVFTLPGARLIDIPYCTPTYSVGTSWLNGSYRNNDYIHRVVLAGDTPPGINNNFNTNGPPAPFGLPSANPCYYSAHPPDYEYFPPSANKTAVLTVGSTYNISLQVGTWGGSNYIAAWIDYNRINGFELSERIAQSGSLPSLGTFAVNFTVPAGAVPGNARLRVREVYARSNIDACASYTYGETEDYIVTLLPQCAPAWPGWKSWLGFTNDWDNPSNWCGGVPTLADNARIPGPGVGPNDRPGNFDPVIKSNVFATTNALRIESNAVVEINAPSAGSLRVAGEMLLLDNTSSLEVNSTFLGDAVVSNGLLTAPTVASTNMGFKNSPKSRSVWLFSQADLAGEGLQSNDIITNLQMQVQRNSTNNVPYKNVTIKVYYTTGTPLPGFVFAGVTLGQMPPVIGAAPLTVFTGDLDLSATIPTIGNWGVIDFPLSTPFAWDGSTNKLVVDMCYDNQGFATPNSFDNFRFTQTLGFRHYINIFNTKDNFNYPGCSMVVSSNAPNGATTGNAGNTFINVTSPSVSRLAVGQWVNGVGANLSIAGAVNGAHAVGATTINMNNTTGISIGHYLNLANGPQVIAVTINSITLSDALQSGLANNQTLNFRPAIVSIVVNTVNLSAPLVANASGVYNFGTLNTLPNAGSEYRPNITFKFTRPYDQYPIRSERNWTNNGTFIPGFSHVSMFPAAPLTQIVGGTNPSTFYDLTINNNTNVLLNQDITVTDTLYLTNGRLKLNNRLLSLTNNDITALRRVNGWLQSEQDVLGTDVAPYGRVRWNMGAGLGTRVIPFINAAGADVQLDYIIDAGTHDVTFATYATPPSNLNLPAPVTSITQIMVPGSTWSTDGSGVVDRYYMIDNTAGSGGPQADINFRYAFGERAATGNVNMRAQRWVDAANQWDLLPFLPGQTHTVATPDIVSLPNFTQFTTSQWWTIVGEATPLPVSLLSFTAKPYKDKVKLNWVTGSEFNSSHFEIERTVDNKEFNFIDRVQSRGPSTGNLEYFTWDMNPVEGTQYYYLRQHDVDGRMESFGPVAATFSKDLFDIVTVAISSTELGMSVVFNYDSNEPYSYKIIDMTGRVIVSKDRNPGEPGVNVIDIDAKMSKGAYQIMLQNSKKTVSRKFFY